MKGLYFLLQAAFPKQRCNFLYFAKMFVLGDLILSLLGRLYLYMRYGRTEKMRRILTEEYDDSFRTAGRVLLLNGVGRLGLLALVLAFMIIVYSIFAHHL